MSRSLAFLAALPAVALAGPAVAGQASAVLEVRAVVVESCSVTADTLDFALDTAPGARAQGQASVALSCNGPAAYEVALDSGRNGSGGVRQMVDPESGRALAYEIYSDAARTARWGNVLGVDTLAGTADADGRAVLTAYGVTLTDGSSLAAGSYADAVVVTVNF